MEPALAPAATQGDLSNYNKHPDDPSDHAIGRSRGGLTAKIYALADQHCSAVTMGLSPGQAYSHDSTRTWLCQLTITHTISERNDQIARRKSKGRNGGRPPAPFGRIYKHRNTVERSFNRFKRWRGIAARCDEYALSYLGGVTLAAIVIYHRVRN